MQDNINESLSVKMIGQAKVFEHYNGERNLIRQKRNAIHRQNMARIIARGLANEPNSIIYRLALGNGGTFTDSAQNVIYREPNDGRDSGWESRLYNETYSEIVDDSNAGLGTDPGTGGRVGGGSDPLSDPTGAGTTSQEVGTVSNVTVRFFLNENEPFTQLESSTTEPTDQELCFEFDEIGLYSPGLPPIDTAGTTQVNVGERLSTDISNIQPDDVLTIEVTVDGNTYNSTLTVPSVGTGPSGEITFGDICEGINTGSWITSGSSLNDFVYVYITDRTNGTYPSIVGQKSFGFLTFESQSVGVGSSVSITCDDSDTSDFFNNLTNGVCANCNVNTVDGKNAGVKNDSANPENERERLLTHLIFDKISKRADRTIEIEYTLTTTVMKSQNSQVETIQN